MTTADSVRLANYQPHTVEVWCVCKDLEQCMFEKYISDIRILQSENIRLRNRLEAITRLASAS